jgi:hypothetical protein
MLALTERHVLTETIGPKAEAIVYLYASCDRQAVYPRLSPLSPVLFTNRFTGVSRYLPENGTKAWLELTAANELDLVLANPEAGARWAPEFYRLLCAGRRWTAPVERLGTCRLGPDGVVTAAGDGKGQVRVDERTPVMPCRCRIDTTSRDRPTAGRRNRRLAAAGRSLTRSDGDRQHPPRNVVGVGESRRFGVSHLDGERVGAGRSGLSRDASCLL